MKKTFQDATILVVDDDDDLRSALAADFKFKGCKVLTAANGVEAFNVILHNHIDVVISDIRMPGGHGVALLDQLKERNVHAPPIILITGYADLSVDDAYDKGADGLFTKPFDRKLLMAKVLKELQPAEERWVDLPVTPVELSAEVDSESLSKALQTEVIRLGRGGMFLTSSEVFPIVDKKISFRIRPHETPDQDLTGTAVVRWVSVDNQQGLPRGYGVEFSYLSPAFRDYLIQEMNRLPVKAFIPKPNRKTKVG